MNPGPVAGEGFSRGDRLRKRREFEECYASGSRISGRHLQIFLLPESGSWRLGISIPRRVGTAARRNRVRRRLREIFRRHRSLLGSAGFRLVINARPSAAGATFQELLEDYRQILSRATRPGKAGR
ncbi:MAG: ribonuclease P protein component [Thermoanaerobaculia bacterium]|nr:ribonuclease P protein component [Thermoanaerobaculia bacterium]